MKKLLKPNSLKPGDTVALVSPSSGMAGENFVQHRIKTAVTRLENDFQLNVKIMPNSYKGVDYLFNNPQKRAEDINNAFSDKSIKAIISFIGGKDSVKIIQYLNTTVIKNNPKIFMGYSDATAIHLFLYKHGISSFYGPAILTDFAENLSMDEYTKYWVNKVLFSNKDIGDIPTSSYYRQFGLKWEESNHHIERKKVENFTYEVINGNGKTKGQLIGGCMESLGNLRGTFLFPDSDEFKGKILFLENSEDQFPIWLLEQNIRTLGVLKILENVNGIIIGKPQNEKNYTSIKNTWKSVLQEFNQLDKPVLFNGSFGHNEPKCILPYGIKAELDTLNKTFKLCENACS